MALEMTPQWLRSLDEQAEDAWLELRCEQARERFIESLMQSSGKTREEVTAILDERFPETPRILPADEPPKKADDRAFAVALGVLLTCSGIVLWLGMKVWDIFWRLTR